MTYKEAKAQGYVIVYRAWQRGYVSRKVNMDDQPVLVAGGKRRGMLYVVGPSWVSTVYCMRYYLAKR